MIDIFISYRRSDSAGHARFLHERLSRFFDQERVFFDRDCVQSSEIFPDRLRHGIEEAKAILVVIAGDWLTVNGKDGNRRLDDPNDFVRMEVVKALELSYRARRRQRH